MSAIVRVENLSVHSPDKKALLSDVTFSLENPEFLVLIGANGAGKTSLLRALANDIPSRHVDGKINIFESSIRNISSLEFARSTAYLPQSSYLDFDFTVEEVVDLGRTPHETGVKIDREVVNASLAELEIVHLRNRIYPTLSGGEKQRVQLARVFAQLGLSQNLEGKVLLLDEPLTGLDIGHQYKLMRCLSQLVNKGVTVITVLHDFVLAAKFATKLLALETGRQCVFGSPQELITSELISRLFGVNAIVKSDLTSGQLHIDVVDAT